MRSSPSSRRSCVVMLRRPVIIARISVADVSASPCWPVCAETAAGRDDRNAMHVARARARHEVVALHGGRGMHHPRFLPHGGRQPRPRAGPAASARESARETTALPSVCCAYIQQNSRYATGGICTPAVAPVAHDIVVDVDEAITRDESSDSRPTRKNGQAPTSGDCPSLPNSSKHLRRLRRSYRSGDTRTSFQSSPVPRAHPPTSDQRQSLGRLRPIRLQCRTNHRVDQPPVGVLTS